MYFDNIEKWPKFCAGPASPSPGPILLRVATTAVKLVTRSLSSSVTINTDIEKTIIKVIKEFFTMNVIDKARELGKMIQEDERYAAYIKAKEANDGDSELQQMINEFQMKRVELNAEMAKDDRSAERLTALDNEIKSLYGTIMGNKNMLEYNEAKTAMDDLLTQINVIITYSANGEDPMTCPTEEPGGCGGSCSTCGGCH